VGFTSLSQRNYVVIVYFLRVKSVNAMTFYDMQICEEE